MSTITENLSIDGFLSQNRAPYLLLSLLLLLDFRRLLSLLLLRLRLLARLADLDFSSLSLGVSSFGGSSLTGVVAAGVTGAAAGVGGGGGSSPTTAAINEAASFT